MHKFFLPSLGLTGLLLSSASPLAAQGPSSPPLPYNGARAAAVTTPTPNPAAYPMAASPSPTVQRFVVVPDATPTSASLGSEVTPPPEPSTPTPNNTPVPPTADQARAQAAALGNLRRLIRDTQTNTDNVKSVGNFGAQLYLINDEVFFQNWVKPETPTITPVGLVLRGSPIYTVVIFYGPARDNKGLCNVSYDLTVKRPNGTVYQERKNLVGNQGLAVDDRQLQLGRNYIGINLAPDDPAGLYTVEAVVHDNVGRVDLPLKQTFVVQQAP